MTAEYVRHLVWRRGLSPSVYWPTFADLEWSKFDGR